MKMTWWVEGGRQAHVIDSHLLHELVDRLVLLFLDFSENLRRFLVSNIRVLLCLVIHDEGLVHLGLPVLFREPDKLVTLFRSLHIVEGTHVQELLDLVEEDEVDLLQEGRDNDVEWLVADNLKVLEGVLVHPVRYLDEGLAKSGSQVVARVRLVYVEVLKSDELCLTAPGCPQRIEQLRHVLSHSVVKFLHIA